MEIFHKPRVNLIEPILLTEEDNEDLVLGRSLIDTRRNDFAILMCIMDIYPIWK